MAGKISGVQASLASTMMRLRGAARRTAVMRSRSPSPPSLILSSGREADAVAWAAMVSTEPSEMVKAVVTASGAERPRIS